MHGMRSRRILLDSAPWANLSAAFAESERSASCEPWSFLLLVTRTMDLAPSCHHGKSAQKIERTYTGVSQNFRRFNDLLSNTNTEFSVADRYPGMYPLNFLGRFAMMAWRREIHRSRNQKEKWPRLTWGTSCRLNESRWQIRPGRWIQKDTPRSHPMHLEKSLGLRAVKHKVVRPWC
jgi:hypothetical protein